ncbi:MAG: ATP-binding protein [Coriobacteriia bacterium]|nr:ATP-binding protein [Coriobacteriia bacterium]
MMESLRELARSYRVRIALGYVLIVTILAGAWAWSLYGPLTGTVIEQQRAHLASIARAGALALERPGLTAPTTANDLVRGTRLRATIVATDGTVLADTAEMPARMANHAGRPEVSAALAGRVGFDTRLSATTGTEQMYVAVPARFEGRLVALRVAEPVAVIAELAATARRTGFALLAVTLIAAFAVAARVSRSASQPVVRLKRAAEAMAAGDLRTPVPATTGELAGLADALGSLRDQMRARLGELEQGRDTLRAVLDGLEDAVLLFEGESVRVANAASSRMFRAPAAGWESARLAGAGLPASLTATIAGALARRSDLMTDVGPDPENRFFRVTALPLDPADRSPRMLVVISDVTATRRLDQVRRDFVANASHELKTPTAAIQLLAESATTAAEDGETEIALVFAGQMRDEADRLRHLVVDLLDLSRLESTPAPGTITDVRAALANALAAHRASAGLAGLSIRADDSAVVGLDVYVSAEPADTAVALDNLLANAIAYTEEGEAVVRVTADETTVTIAVSDTGVGIPAEHLGRVFERFYRVDGARSRMSGGTGLGLALVKHVAERSGGSVEIASTVGEGTTVTLHLPRAR